MSLNINQIKEIIPHRYPFLLVDRIEEMEPGVKAVGYKNVTVNEPFFQGHFPQQPVMPGVLIVEALAQVGAVAVLSLEENKGKLAFFGGINKAKFRKQVEPGDVLKLETEIIKVKGPMGVGKATASVDGKVACSAEISFIISDAK
ncbi:MAG: 3-hydroxyacyl-ACP dehydratase FabZ [Eubacterium sp.]|nr:3-hydroxyacyl-ACP dehydratase FabZ [Eubacterium sp.]